MRTARTFKCYAVLLALALYSSDVGPTPSAPLSRPTTADHAHGQLLRVRDLTLTTLRGGGQSAQVCVCMCACVRAFARACMQSARAHMRACDRVSGRGPGRLFSAGFHLLWLHPLALLSPQSLNDEACRFMSSGDEHDLSRAEDLLQRALAMEVAELLRAPLLWLLLLDAAFTVKLALAPAYERINAVTLPPESCSSSSHALPRFPSRPRLPTVCRAPVQPSYAASLCNYGRLLQKRQHDLDLAGDLMAKAVRLHPEQPALMSSYALFLEDGVRDPIRAQEVYERALQLHPSDTVPFCSLFHMASWHSSFELQT